MSKKHEQRTRAQILARRAAPSELPAPVIVVPTGMLTVHPGAQRYLDNLRFTAETRGAMRSKYMPHEGKQQR